MGVNKPVKEFDQDGKGGWRLLKNRYFIITTIILLIVALILAGISYYQATRFNSKITINEIEIGGLTAQQAIEKLQTTTLANKVYVGDELILDEKDTPMAFSKEDLSAIKKILKKQWTFFPSLKAKNYWLFPEKADEFRSETMVKQLEEKLLSVNKKLKAPKDSEVQLKDGKIVISESKDGEQYDIPALLKDFESQNYTSDIHLTPVYKKPITADSSELKEVEQVMEDFLKQTVNYKVQNKVYSLKASELIQNASISKNKKITIQKSDIQKKVAEINESQSTLNKNFKFKTHSGKVISVKGQGYGWALDVEKEAGLIQKAFEKGEKEVSASNIYGHGWNNEGYGYETTANNGIGDTYAEVSIAEQRIWIYRNGKLAVTTDVVTGKHSTGEDTHPGVWYILFKRSPYTLKGSAVGKPDYEIEVNYWAPFTNDGQGFHDASWRKNWSKTAYLKDGSGGCVNTPPSIMKKVYDNLNTYDPVVIY